MTKENETIPESLIDSSKCCPGPRLEIDPIYFSKETLEELSEMIAEKVISKMKKSEDDKRRILIQQKSATGIR